jgi:hypothetical protein
VAEVQRAVVFCALPAVQCGQACLEGDVNDPLERQPARNWAHARVHAGPAAGPAGAAARGRQSARGSSEHAAAAADARDPARDDLLPLGGQVPVLARAGGWCHVMLLLLDASAFCCADHGRCRRAGAGWFGGPGWNAGPVGAGRIQPARPDGSGRSSTAAGRAPGRCSAPVWPRGSCRPACNRRRRIRLPPIARRRRNGDSGPGPARHEWSPSSWRPVRAGCVTRR